jgi:serine/threonine protein kinase
MPLHQNSQLLVDTLRALPLLDGRFTDIRLVNYNAASGEKRGCFSLVFSAIDTTSGRRVALKFYDLDPNWVRDKYRRESFVRESEILQSLLNRDRCLQLVQAVSPYDLPVNAGGVQVVLACQYFAVEWIDGEIDRYFSEQHAQDPVDKLHLFNEIVLAVEALHRSEIFHRDLKADNLRAIQDVLKRVVVAIDLGTAARFDSGYLRSSYTQPVGAPAYAAAEAMSGLAANRQLAPYTDVYALGCLLFELFNADYFFYAQRRINQNLDARLTAMAQSLTDRSSEEKEIQQWRVAISKFGAGVTPVTINGPGSSVPPGIAPILNEALAQMTHIDYLRRPKNLEFIRRKIWIAIRLLQHQREYQARLERARDLRRKRVERARELDLRHARLRGPGDQ